MCGRDRLGHCARPPAIPSTHTKEVQRLSGVPHRPHRHDGPAHRRAQRILRLPHTQNQHQERDTTKRQTAAAATSQRQTTTTTTTAAAAERCHASRTVTVTVTGAGFAHSSPSPRRPWSLERSSRTPIRAAASPVAVIVTLTLAARAAAAAAPSPSLLIPQGPLAPSHTAKRRAIPPLHAIPPAAAPGERPRVIVEWERSADAPADAPPCGPPATL
mmetsp:Transcript_5470/g.15232  ORF Transcript_5470/g.15232 Transcript_5470/m.15232 type:complete len:216 (+) Transcript_5470:953-1600(+)